jgi:hypothetical protein
MQRFSLFLVVLLAVVAFAQDTQSPQNQQPGPANNYGVPAAPKPGHSLDPNDVAVLTGKTGNSATAQRQYATPQLYYSDPTGGSMFSQSSVGYAFGQQPNFSIGYGNNWQSWQNRGGSWESGAYYGGYSNLNGSQFANVTTETSPFRLGHPRGRRRPGFGPTFFFGNRTPGFGFNRWRPNLWSSPAQVKAPTGSMFSPGLRP